MAVHFRNLAGKRDSYLDLVRAHPLVSIRSEDQFEAARDVMDQLLAKGKLGSGEEQYLDALSDLVAAYEDKHYPIKPASDADMLQHLMEAKGVSQTQLSKDTQVPKSTVSEILSGKKRFSRELMHTFADYFKVDVSVLAANL